MVSRQRLDRLLSCPLRAIWNYTIAVIRTELKSPANFNFEVIQLVTSRCGNPPSKTLTTLYTETTICAEFLHFWPFQQRTSQD